ncbi:MAG TPA: hypothetical protein V6D05_03830 [Stenomitos sp.]
MTRFVLRYLPLALILLPGLLAGCPEEAITGSGNPKPAVSASSNPNIVGGVSTSSDGAPAVRMVNLTPTGATLNAPAIDGTEPAGLASSRSFEVQVLLSDGSTDSRGVSWSVSDASRLSVEAGEVRVKPGTPAGSYAVTATSIGEPATPQTAIIQVTTDGLLHLEVSPAPDPEARLSVNVVRNGQFVRNQPIEPVSNIRLPAGSGYVAQVQQSGNGGDKLSPLLNFVITPNGVATASVSLQ